MDDKKLRALLAVVRAGSFSRAAEEIGYTQSGMTQMMNSLENELGCPLFLRGFSGVSLTEEGQLLLPFIEEVERAMRRLRDETALVVSGESRPLRVGTSAAIARSWLPAVLKAYCDAHRDAAVELRIGEDELPLWLEDGTIDLAVTDDCRCSARWLLLHEEGLAAVVPGEMADGACTGITLKALAERPLLLTPLHRHCAFSALLPESGEHESILLRNADTAMLLSLVEQGLGVTVLPQCAVRGQTAAVRILPLEPPLFWRLGAALPRTPTGRAGDFVRFLQKQSL